MERKKPRKPRKGRASEQCITRRGLHIHQKGDQIRALTGNRWDVASQGTEGVWYRVSFAGESPTCECAYHTTGKGCRCKHIAAVEHAKHGARPAGRARGAGANTSRRSSTRCSYRPRPPSARSWLRRRAWRAQTARKRRTPATDGTTAGTRRGRGTGAPHAGGGSGTTWALSTARCRACTSRWP